ncbi:hypothetical protein Bca52824_011144 [Brassica carinata]|uniref:Uncharacterized protein n=1 Tax=Brassica carinata TaxID=52824 RepID=A0A8X7WES2_BRACI|nr:hypothetical protein Bca52824_011144 [Brassica carinata]
MSDRGSVDGAVSLLGVGQAGIQTEQWDELRLRSGRIWYWPAVGLFLVPYAATVSRLEDPGLSLASFRLCSPYGMLVLGLSGCPFV